MQQYCDCLLFNKQGKLLLLLRSEISTIEPNKWCLPGGHQDPGEGLEFACFREVLEETAIELDDNLITLETLENPDGSSSHYFMAEDITFEQEKSIVIDPYEHKGFGFFSVEEIDDLDLMFDLKERLLTTFFSLLISKSLNKVFNKIKTIKLTPEEEVISTDITIKSFQQILFNKGYTDEDSFLETLNTSKDRVISVYFPVGNIARKIYIKEDELNKSIDFEHHARNASENALMNSLKMAKEEGERLAAQKELQRRRKEEYGELTEEEQTEDVIDFNDKDEEFCNKFFEDMLENSSIDSEEAMCIKQFYKNDINGKLVESTSLLDRVDKEIISTINEAFDEAIINTNIILYKNIVTDSENVSQFFESLKEGAIYRDSTYCTLFTGFDHSMSTMYKTIKVKISKGKKLLPIKKDNDRDLFYFMLPKNSIFKVISNNSDGLIVEVQ